MRLQLLFIRFGGKAIEATIEFIGSGVVILLGHLLRVQHAGKINTAKEAGRHGGIHSLNSVGQLVNMALLDGGAVRQGGIVQNRINVIFSIGCQNDVIGVPIQDLLIGNFGPVGIFHAGGGVCAVGVSIIVF